eukprot:TRINITY_DN37967_c0_g1_i1.p3 TRINITY_DN37967_c0_g1~~TRINITY_DN37967_c0_g1_i1.p3  ORF type:complete len:110 (+),score=3.04 TRINITY_DN37967_c0_g1_i1:224-553(+)
MFIAHRENNMHANTHKQTHPQHINHAIFTTKITQVKVGQSISVSQSSRKEFQIKSPKFMPKMLSKHCSTRLCICQKFVNEIVSCKFWAKEDVIKHTQKAIKTIFYDVEY